jgi:DNA (cytosine-5)-methyltransferase 1
MVFRFGNKRTSKTWVYYKLLNAVNFGVPQNRERLFVFGHRAKFNFPRQQLKKVTVGEAIGDTMQHFYDDSRFLTASMDTYVANYEKASACINPRDLYADRPARTLTCRNLAGATGDMQRVKLPDGRRRRINYREAARLQSFPDWFEFEGNETQQFNQIGNAVPPLLAYQLAQALKECYRREEVYSCEEAVNSYEIILN